MAIGRRDPFLAFNFIIKIGNTEAGGFTEVTGLQAEVEVHDYREGGLNQYIRKLSGPVRYPSNLVLKRGLASSQLWKWYQDVVRRKIERKNISIELLEDPNAEKWTWNFKQAYPVRWNGPELRANTAAVAVETVEFVHRGLMEFG